jgi:hypothetical protein
MLTAERPAVHPFRCRNDEHRRIFGTFAALDFFETGTTQPTGCATDTSCKARCPAKSHEMDKQIQRTAFNDDEKSSLLEGRKLLLSSMIYSLIYKLPDGVF